MWAVAFGALVIIALVLYLEWNRDKEVRRGFKALEKARKQAWKNKRM